MGTPARTNINRVKNNLDCDQHSYNRYLPHRQPYGAVIFVTFRTFGSLPASVEQELHRRALDLKTRMVHLSGEDPEVVTEWKKLFKFADDHLDRSNLARHLQNSAAARIVMESIHRGQSLNHYRLHRYCIMSNHVHLLIEPLPLDFQLPHPSELDWSPLFFQENIRGKILRGREPASVKWNLLPDILKGIKGTTSRKIGKLLNIPAPIWMSESYDHWIRNESEYGRVVQYIDNNPVKAGLCNEAHLWEWGSFADSKVVE